MSPGRRPKMVDREPPNVADCAKALPEAGNADRI